jgi:hypothetical protein
MILEVDITDASTQKPILSFWGNYDLVIRWGDGREDTLQGTNDILNGYKDHQYSSPGIYRVMVIGSATGFGRKDFYPFFPNNDLTQLTRVVSWGEMGITDMKYTFDSIPNSFSVPKIFPSSVTDASGLFYGCSAFNDDGVVTWDMSRVENMAYMFTSTGAFNQDIGGWDVSSVRTFNFMFAWSTAFNNGGEPMMWTPSSATNMASMFSSVSWYLRYGSYSISVFNSYPFVPNFHPSFYAGASLQCPYQHLDGFLRTKF